jgi:hypothetical protein
MGKSNPNSSISISGGSFYESSIAAGSEEQAHTIVTFNQRSFNAAQTPIEFIAELEKLAEHKPLLS